MLGGKGKRIDLLIDEKVILRILMDSYQIAIAGLLYTITRTAIFHTKRQNDHSVSLWLI